MRIAVITSRTAKPIIEDVLRDVKGVDIVALPVHAISFLDAEALARIIERDREALARLREADVVLVPGSVRGDVSSVEKLVGKPVFKASKSPALLPSIISYVSRGGSLSRVESAERYVASEGYSGYSGEFEEAFNIGRVRVPLRPPPVVLAAEVPPGRPPEEASKEASRLLRDGADMLVVGVGFDEDPGAAGSRVEAVVDATRGVPVLSEAPSRLHAEAAVAGGSSGLVVSASSVEWALEALPPRGALVIGSSDLDELGRAAVRALEAGVKRVILDPVVGLPLIGFIESLERIRRAASRFELPIAFTAANFVEEIEADTHGVHAVLAVAAVEAGASVYYVVEDSYKSYRGVAEASEALRIASEAARLRSTPRGLPSGLYVVKQPVRPPREDPGVEAERVGYVEPRWDRRGYVRVYVDHERGVIVAVYRLYTGRVVAAVEGRHAPSVARALVRAAGLDPEHAAYLGYELAKAELALTLGKSYTQDEPVIVPVWGWLAEEGRGVGAREGHSGGGALRSPGSEGAGNGGEPEAEGDRGGGAPRRGSDNC